MTKKDAFSFLSAYLECFQWQSSPVFCCSGCEDCVLSYVRGTNEEQQEAIQVALAALKEDLEHDK